MKYSLRSLMIVAIGSLGLSLAAGCGRKEPTYDEAMATYLMEVEALEKLHAQSVALYEEKKAFDTDNGSSLLAATAEAINPISEVGDADAKKSAASAKVQKVKDVIDKKSKEFMPAWEAKRDELDSRIEEQSATVERASELVQRLTRE